MSPNSCKKLPNPHKKCHFANDTQSYKWYNTNIFKYAKHIYTVNGQTMLVRALSSVKILSIYGLKYRLLMDCVLHPCWSVQACAVDDAKCTCTCI